jgi:LPS-assembly lipoprotein
MWSCSRRTLLVGLLPLAACGFRPALGTGGVAKGLQGQIGFDAPDDRRAFDLVERLEERLGRTRAPVWRLSYEIVTDTTGLAITPQNATTRFQVDGTVRFKLTDAATGAVADEGRVTGFTSYSAFGTQVSTAAQREDAEARLMRLLADQIVTRLIAGVAAQGAPA